MENQSAHVEVTQSAVDNVSLLGYYAAILTSVVTIITLIIAALTPPISGANCVDSCVEYPFSDIASRFPRDYYWIYLAIVMIAVFLVWMVCIHQYAAPDKKVFSQIGLSFALISASVLIVNYFVQVSVIQPGVENAEADGIALLTQYNSHGMFIVLEELGYLLMSAAFLFMAPVFGGETRIEKAVRWIFILSFVLAILALIFLSVAYGINREDRFEVMVILIDWTVLIVNGMLLSRIFKRSLSRSSSQK